MKEDSYLPMLNGSLRKIYDELSPYCCEKQQEQACDDAGKDIVKASDGANVKPVASESVNDSQAIFKSEDVDVFEEGSTLWFCLSDVGKILGLSKSSVRMMKSNKWFDEDEIKMSKDLTSSTGQSKIYISESALYRVLNRSNSPKAKPFERWVTKTVIPSVRKADGSKLMPFEDVKGTLTVPNTMPDTADARVFNGQFGNLTVLESNGETWFKVKDICDVLELTNPSIVIESLQDFERSKFNLGREGNTWFVNESGLYTIVLRSRKEKAEPFRIWVTKTVIPSIRKNGGYIANQKNMSPELIVANALIVANNIIESQKRELEESRKTILEQQPKVQVYEKISDSTGCKTVSEVAKINGLGPKVLFAILRDNGIFFREGNVNLPKQIYIDRGYFVVKEKPYEKPDGKSCLYSQICVTAKGELWMSKLLNEIA